MLFGKTTSMLAIVLCMAGTAAYASDTSTSQRSGVKSFKGAKLVKDAKISLADARTIALKAHPGQVTDEELEREHGGSGLRYSFDIKSIKGTQEVGVDAKTWVILESKLEGVNPD
jgi:uncharacterized membrane protein YkoI